MTFAKLLLVSLQHWLSLLNFLCWLCFITFDISGLRPRMFSSVSSFTPLESLALNILFVPITHTPGLKNFIYLPLELQMCLYPAYLTSLFWCLTLKHDKCHIYIYTHIIYMHQVTREHWVEFSELYCRFLLVIYVIYRIVNMSVPISRFISSSLPCLGFHMLIDCLHLFFFLTSKHASPHSLYLCKEILHVFSYSGQATQSKQDSFFFYLSSSVCLLLMLLSNIPWGSGVFTCSSPLSFVQSTITPCLNYNSFLIYLLPLCSSFYFHQSICNTETRMKL